MAVLSHRMEKAKGKQWFQVSCFFLSYPSLAILQNPFPVSLIHTATCATSATCATVATMRTFMTWTPEEYQKLKSEAGLVPLSKYLKNKFMSSTPVIINNEGIRKWVEFLETVSDNARILKDFLSEMKAVGNKPESVFFKRLLPHGFDN